MTGGSGDETMAVRSCAVSRGCSGSRSRFELSSLAMTSVGWGWVVLGRRVCMGLREGGMGGTRGGGWCRTWCRGSRPTSHGREIVNDGWCGVRAMRDAEKAEVERAYGTRGTVGGMGGAWKRTRSVGFWKRTPCQRRRRQSG